MSFDVDVALKGAGHGKGKDRSSTMDCGDVACLQECLQSIRDNLEPLVATLVDGPEPKGCKVLTQTMHITNPAWKHWKGIKICVESDCPQDVMDQILAAYAAIDNAPCVMKALKPAKP